MKNWINEYNKKGLVEKFQLGGIPSTDPYKYTPEHSLQSLNIASNMMSYPQKKVTQWITGKFQSPSEAMGINNKFGQFAVDAVLDPVNLIGVGLGKQMIKSGAKQAGKYLIENTALKNAYKLNPFAFKPKEGMMYRGIGEEGMKDAIINGIFRGNPKRGMWDVPYFSDRFHKAAAYDNSYMAEVPKNAVEWEAKSNSGLKPKYFNATEPIPIEKGRILKKDWFQRYKEIPIQKRTTPSSFTSEIDWGKWNKEIPENPELLKEYHTIEQTTKNNGSWMKPLQDSGWETSTDKIILRNAEEALSTGTIHGRQLTEQEIGVLSRTKDRLSKLKADSETYNGTPEQFIQEQSRNFKNAFPEGSELTYRGGTGNHTFRGSLASSDNPDIGSVFTADKEAARHYGSSIPIKSSEDTHSGLLELLYNKSDNVIKINGKNSGWRDLPNVPDEVASDIKNWKRKNNYTAQNVIDTDDISAYLQRKQVNYADIRNIHDGVPVVKEIIFNHRPGNYLKSRVGNNGMFDMSNPNIYKGVIGVGAITEANRRFRSGGILKYQTGNKISQNEIDRNNLIDKGFIKQSNDSWRNKLSQGITRFQESQPEGLKVFGSFLPGYGDALDISDTTKAFSTGDSYDKALSVAGMVLPFIGVKMLNKFKPNIKRNVISWLDKYGINYDNAGKDISKIGSTTLGENSSFSKTMDNKIFESVVNYPNNSAVASYINPRTKSRDIFVGVPNNKSTSDYIGFQRSNGFNGPENKFHITADMPNSSSEEVKDLMTKMNSVLPRYHELYEPKTISMDGLNMWKNQLKNGYISTDKFSHPHLSGSAKNNTFKGSVDEGDNKFGVFKFENKEEQNKVVADISEFFRKNNIPGGVAKIREQSIQLNLPILKRTFGIAVPVGLGVYKYENNKNK